MVMEEQTEVIGVRVTKKLKKLIDKYLEMDAHLSYGDFFRDAAREKIQKDAPELYKMLFKRGEKKDAP
jgi:metal-responsive CopG/Arc/MetJ family transcriptional regulator